MQAFLRVARDTSPTLSSKRAPTLSSKRARSSNYADRSIPSSRALSIFVNYETPTACS